MAPIIYKILTTILVITSLFADIIKPEHLDTLAKIIEYEARPHTEVKKVQVLYTSEDSETQGESPTKSVGQFKEYHASETVSKSRDINMLLKWTANPNDEVDAGLVSLTAD